MWEGFWNADPRFWDPHPQRFSRGLEHLVALAREKNMHLGLWFAPDSWNEFSNWRKDAERVLELFTTLGIKHFKIDGVNAPTETAQCNLKRFFTIGLAAGVPEQTTWETLASAGAIESHGGRLCITIPHQLGFVFARFTRKD